MTLSSRFTLLGQVREVAASGPSELLTVTAYGANPLVTVITRVDLSGKVAWQRTYPGTGRPQSRLSTKGTLWVAYPDGDGRVPEETGVDHWEPLLVSADRIAASFTDTRGGIGRTFFLDLDSGETVSVTPPALRDERR